MRRQQEFRWADRCRADCGLPARAAAAIALAAFTSVAAAQEKRPPQEPPKPPKATAPATGVGVDDSTDAAASELLHVPVVDLQIGGVVKQSPIVNPITDPQKAAQRGMKYYNQFNCVGCHAPNGAGGMGPSLSNSTFIYGSEPENIYLSILQGRPAGMPSWGGRLPDHVIWDIVAYVQNISKEPAPPWGTTTSADGFKIEQVPAEYLKTVEPWKHTTPFSYGQAPFEKPKGAPPKETPNE